MSIGILIRPGIPHRDLFDGRFDYLGIKELRDKDGGRWLTDGQVRMRLYVDDDTGVLHKVMCYGVSQADPRVILKAIREEFAVEMFTEYQPEYWGYKTEDEWVNAFK